VPATPKPGKNDPEDLKDSFAQAAPLHDRNVSPVLALYRRLMENALVNVRDKLVLGIGYALDHEMLRLYSRGARAHEARFSPEDLIEGSDTNELIVFDDPDLDLADAILCSFALSYIKDASVLAERLAELVVPGADLYLVDLHPETDRLGWRKPFAPEGLPVELPVTVHELSQVRQVFDNAGFELESLMEPRLGHPEKRLFENIVRPDLFDQVRHMPAMYLFHFRRRLLSADRLKRVTYRRSRPQAVHLTGARVALGPHTSVQADIVLDPDRIRGIYDRPALAKSQRAEDDVIIDLSGYMLLPGMINAHDHLISFADLRNDTPREAALWMGALKNVMSGVTTVLHHEEDNAAVFGEGFPIRVVKNYGYSDSLEASEIVPQFASTSPDAPFVVKIATGDREEGLRAVQSLQQLRVINDRTVVIHGGGIDPEVAGLLHQLGASQVWCPSTEMVQRDSEDYSFLRSNHRIALGTGSSDEKSPDIFEEIQTALSLGVPAEALYSMVTSRPCSILRLHNGEGRIVGGTPADLIFVRDGGGTPSETLAAVDSNSLEAVILGGRPLMATKDMVNHWPQRWRNGLEPILYDGHQRWVRWQLQRLVRNFVDRAGSPQLAGRTLTV